VNVYRIESANGTGPYQSGRYSFDLCMAHSDDPFHPQPQHDPLLGPPEFDVDFCGCDSPQSLADWFAGWLDRLHDDGFVVTVWEAENPSVGEYGQVLFQFGNAWLRDSLSIPDFLANYLDTAA
jgi:hypothetical protein